MINYAGNIYKFTYLGDLTSINNLDVVKEIEGKIVLLGFTGIMHSTGFKFCSMKN